MRLCFKKSRRIFFSKGIHFVTCAVLPHELSHSFFLVVCIVSLVVDVVLAGAGGFEECGGVCVCVGVGWVDGDMRGVLVG